MANPLIAQGTLNRLIASVVWNSFPTLNVTAPYLGEEGITLGLEGESTAFLPTLTGAVTSPEPYMMVNLSIHLLRTQGLAGLYKTQLETNALLGDGTVRPDSTQLGSFQIVNCALEGVREMKYNGKDYGFMVTLKGYYNINSALWG